MTDKPAQPAAGKPDEEEEPVTGEAAADDAVARAVADDTASGAEGSRADVGPTADSAGSATATSETESTTELDPACRTTPEGAEPAKSGPSAGESAGSATATANSGADAPETADSDAAPSGPASEGVVRPGSTVRTPENSSAAGSAAERAGSGSWPRIVLGALAVAVVLLIGAVGVAGYLYVQERDKAEVLAAYEEVRQAACQYAPVLANYDAKNLEPYFSAVLDGATGDWKKEFETTTTELREALTAGEVVSTAGDIQCAVKTADPTSAEVVVVIGQTITSLGTQGQPAPGQLAMVMRMQKTDGRWLVDQMTSPLAEPMQ